MSQNTRFQPLSRTRSRVSSDAGVFLCGNSVYGQKGRRTARRSTLCLLAKLGATSHSVHETVVCQKSEWKPPKVSASCSVAVILCVSVCLYACLPVCPCVFACAHCVRVSECHELGCVVHICLRACLHTFFSLPLCLPACTYAHQSTAELLCTRVLLLSISTSFHRA